MITDRPPRTVTRVGSLPEELRLALELARAQWSVLVELAERPEYPADEATLRALAAYPARIALLLAVVERDLDLAMQGAA